MAALLLLLRGRMLTLLSTLAVEGRSHKRQGKVLSGTDWTEMVVATSMPTSSTSGSLAMLMAARRLQTQSTLLLSLGFQADHAAVSNLAHRRCAHPHLANARARTHPFHPSIHSTWPSNHLAILPCCGCAALCCSVLGMPRSSSANIQTEFRRTVEGLE